MTFPGFERVIALTNLENEILGRILRGENPWVLSGGTRVVSQALSRLQKKGTIVYVPERIPSYVATAEGSQSYWPTHADDAMAATELLRRNREATRAASRRA